ncbi:MAG: enoyl-CoA hydratase/isomerase family protein [Rhodospirillaceae bacterium]|nr:enoyl-CoA hydratase/isomerase family protein [Rhodospirillaceae bacterium]
MSARLTINGAVATILLDRPDQRNALDMQMCIDLEAAARQSEAAAEVRVVVIRGAGPAFCAGADLKERRTMTEDRVRERRRRAFAAYAAIEALTKPVIAVVHGAAYGSGAEIATACDFAIAGSAATFCYPEATRGTVGATQRLPRIVGTRMAKDLMLTGRVIDAAEALRIGLVTRVISDADLAATVDEVTATIAKAPPLALKLAKRCIDRVPFTDSAGALANEIAAIEEVLGAGEWREGAEAFAKKDR